MFISPSLPGWSPIQVLTEVDVPYFNERAAELALVDTVSLSVEGNTMSGLIWIIYFERYVICVCVFQNLFRPISDYVNVTMVMTYSMLFLLVHTAHVYFMLGCAYPWILAFGTSCQRMYIFWCAFWSARCRYNLCINRPNGAKIYSSVLVGTTSVI